MGKLSTKTDISTGQGLVGNNMFAYCANNPVVYSDPSGNLFFLALDMETHGFLGSTLQHYTGGGGGGTYGCTTRKPAPTRKDWSALNPFNSDEEVVLNAEHFAFYKGVPVFKADLGNGGAFSFIIIVMDDNYTTDQTGIDTVKHEYGHWVHLSQIGPISYFYTTAVPSLIGAGLDNAGLLPDDLYYNLPWERLADFYGGVQRTEHTDWSLGGAIAFWVYTVSSS